jgi:hypothetical protein
MRQLRPVLTNRGVSMNDYRDIEFCTTEAEVRELVEDSIQDSFERKIAAEWEHDQMEKVIEYWKELEHEDHRD